jgi:Fe-S cluster assembly ATP-binding protein
MEFLKTAMNAQRKARGEDELTIPAFMKRSRKRQPISTSPWTC